MRNISAPPLVASIDSFSKGGLINVARSIDQRLLTASHSHPHGELFLLHAGHLKANSETGHWLIPPLQICWIPPYALHGADTQNLVWTRIHLAPSLCASLPAQPCVWTSSPLARAVIEKLAQQLGTYESISPAEQRLIDVLFDELAAARGAPLLLPMPKSAQLRAAAEKWQRCSEEMAGLDELAELANMSRRTLTRTFKQETGISVGKWRQIARLISGIDMLSEGKSVTDTAMSLGYDSVSSFVSLCHRLTGMSPKTLARVIPRLPR